MSPPDANACGTASTEAYHRDPYGFFASQRRMDPVRWVEFFQGPAWLVTGFPEADAMMRDGRFVREQPGLTPVADRDVPPRVRCAMEMKERMILVRDAPFHTRVRSLINHAFTPAMVERRRGIVEAAARALLAPMRGRRVHDLIADFARQLPLHVICELLGVPARDRERAVAWSGGLLAFIDFHSTEEDLASASGPMLEARQYFTDLLATRRRAPSDDLISHLVAASERHGAISDEEIVATCVVLITAGHETTMNLIGNAYWVLLQQPEQYRQVRQEPALVGRAIEEVLRYESPVITTSRWVSQDLEFRGHLMRRGQFVIIAIGGCNRDPRITADPDRFDIARGSGRHLSFGVGVHYCVGAALARLEATVAIEMLLVSLQHPRLLETPRWANSVALRGFERLLVEADVAPLSLA